MGFQARDLSVLCYANGFTLWHDRTTDTVRTVIQPGYFDAAHDMLAGQDEIKVSAGDGSVDLVVAGRRRHTDPLPAAGICTVIKSRVDDPIPDDPGADLPVTAPPPTGPGPVPGPAAGPPAPRRRPSRQPAEPAVRETASPEPEAA